MTGFSEFAMGITRLAAPIRSPTTSLDAEADDARSAFHAKPCLAPVQGGRQAQLHMLKPRRENMGKIWVCII